MYRPSVLPLLFLLPLPLLAHWCIVSSSMDWCGGSITYRAWRMSIGIFFFPSVIAQPLFRIRSRRICKVPSIFLTSFENREQVLLMVGFALLPSVPWILVRPCALTQTLSVSPPALPKPIVLHLRLTFLVSVGSVMDWCVLEEAGNRRQETLYIIPQGPSSNLQRRWPFVGIRHRKWFISLTLTEFSRKHSGVARDILLRSQWIRGCQLALHPALHPAD